MLPFEGVGHTAGGGSQACPAAPHCQLMHARLSSLLPADASVGYTLGMTGAGARGRERGEARHGSLHALQQVPAGLPPPSRLPRCASSPSPPPVSDAKMVRVEPYRVTIAGGSGGQVRRGWAAPLLGPHAAALALARMRTGSQPAPRTFAPPHPQVYGCVRMGDFLSALAARIKPNPTSADIFRRLFSPPAPPASPPAGEPLQTKVGGRERWRLGRGARRAACAMRAWLCGERRLSCAAEPHARALSAALFSSAQVLFKHLQAVLEPSTVLLAEASAAD